MEDPSIFRDYEPASGAFNNVDHAGMAATLEIYPYITFDCFPSNVFLSTDLAQEAVDLTTTLSTFVRNEVGKFVTGERPLTDAELDKYFDEVGKAGATRLLEIYTQYYNDLNK